MQRLADPRRGGQAADNTALNASALLALGRRRFEAACAPDSPYLRIRPARGDALLFYSFRPDGSFEPLSLHGSCPVVRGDKWIAQQWVRSEVQRPYEGPSFAAGWGLWGRELPEDIPTRGSVFPNRLLGGPAMSVHRSTEQWEDGEDGEERLVGCTESSNLMEGMERTGAWTLLLRVRGLKRCEGEVGGGAGVMVSTLLQGHDPRSSERGPGCCVLRLEVRGCELRLVGPTEDEVSSLQLEAHSEMEDERFIAWSGGLTVQGLEQWPDRWVGSSRVWINGEEAPAAGGRQWNISASYLERWSEVTACAEQPPVGSGQTLASFLLFHANISAEEVRYFCGDSCGNGQPLPPRRDNLLPGCKDEEAHCRVWAHKGECEANAEYMRRSCQASCKLCHLIPK